MIAVVSTTVRSMLLHGIGTAAIWSQRRAALVAVLRAIEVFSFAPIARNHGRQKANHFSAKPRRQPTHHSFSQNGTNRTLRCLIRRCVLCLSCGQTVNKMGRIAFALR